MVNTVTPYAFITAKQSPNFDALTLDSDSATTYATQNFRINGVQKAQIFCDFADGSMVYRTNTSGSSLSFGTNNVERLRITSTGVSQFTGTITCTGNITSGYGTFAAPGFVVGDAQYGLYVDSGNLIYKSGATGLNVWKNTANTVNTMTVDNNGNLVAQGVVTAGSIVRIGTAYTGNNGWINGYFGANIIWDGTNWQNYGFGGNNGWAAMVTTGTGGEFVWISASGNGTSNRTYNETQFLAQKKMTLDSSGNLLVGTASASGSLTVVGAQSVDGSTYYIASLAANNSPVAGRGSGLAFRTNVGSFTPVICAIEGVKENGTTDDYASALDFSTRVNGGLMTKRLRIKSTGQLNLNGLASDPAGAAGDVYYNSTSNRLKYHNGTAWVDSGTRKVSVVGGAGTGTYIDATHNFNTKTVSVTVLRTTDNVVVYTDVAMTNDNTVRVTFASSVTLADYTVTVIG